MNYLRGAVNAISAPYQYYKDLPPINPSTLTGAIDVIVIQRPAEDGSTELVCSPFHVRFGKWQVLRPSEKQVNVFVNGNPIPFAMKIGEAGEAFFVFETEDDVPPDLITSPILQPTIPEESKDQQPEEQVKADRFGAKQDTDHPEATQPEIPVNAPNHEQHEQPLTTEPEFLDLDNGSTQVPDYDHHDDVRTTPRQSFHVPPLLQRSGSKATLSQSNYSTPSHGQAGLPSPPLSRQHSRERKDTQDPETRDQDRRVDAALKRIVSEVHVPEVEYHNDVTLDFEGYKSNYHERERSDKTVRSNGSPSRKSKPSPQRHKAVQRLAVPAHSSPHITLPHTPPYGGDSSSSSSPPPSSPESPTESPKPPQPFRATSEPPPDTEDDRLSALPQHPQLQIPIQEYSWEWGSFPQPSPMRPSFSKGGRLEPPKALWSGLPSDPEEVEQQGVDEERLGRTSERKARASATPFTASSARLQEEGTRHELSASAPNFSVLNGRSRSVPPLLEAMLESHNRHGSRSWREFEDAEESEQERDWAWAEERKKWEFKDLLSGNGTLSAERGNPTKILLCLEDRTVVFQLSLVPDEERTLEHDTAEQQRKAFFAISSVFDRFLIDFDRFMEDGTIVDDPRLTVRWAGDQYVTRHDGLPLLTALYKWRRNTLAQHTERYPPFHSQDGEAHVTLSDAQIPDLHEQKAHGRSKSEPPSAVDIRRAEAEDILEERAESHVSGDRVNRPVDDKPSKPTSTSSSWMPWWGRNRRKDASGKTHSHLNRHNDSSSVSLPLTHGNEEQRKEGTRAGSVPSTPVQRPADLPGAVSQKEATPTQPPVARAPLRKKYAKTLRLTSDQLKSLSLREGANSITFSLSATGAVAATARIFVWDSTDRVVISDIDGTITKSDGLGHVFAMIGRDWTHIGVAKLYTDIVRNGYKIMYLTSRAIGQADATRDYLKGIKQNNYQLPEGPVIMSPDRLMASLHREVIMRKPEVFKMACLRDIQRLFGESSRNPFYAGFGNRITDALSYRSVNVPSKRIFTIDSSGEVKMELLELAGYKSSYIHMTDLVELMFPPIHRKWAPEFTDFNFWKAPIQDFPLPDLSPPSPALSARSDTSNQSTLARLRNFSLGGNANVQRQNSMSSTADGQDEGSDRDPYRNSHLRQMSSLERLSSTLGFGYGRSTSPGSSSSYASSDDEDDEIGVDGHRRKRERRRSMTSMPGSLDDMQFDDEEEEEEHEEQGEGDPDYEEDAGNDLGEEESYDDDLLATGEMQNVPFL
ncbi:Lipin/Ned1/Smp2-domain-containing protein [Panaeolus papilionaceus]|nr:Lipin/Ned1/Smp2-domain-containing protein [Panaeolus papilionaceus]